MSLSMSGSTNLSLKMRYKGGSFLLLIETIVVFTLLYVTNVLQNVVLIVFVIIVGAIIVKFFLVNFLSDFNSHFWDVSYAFRNM